MARDIFAEIAADRKVGKSSELWEPEPAAASARILPLDDRSVRVRSPNRPNTPEELAIALADMRERMGRFLEDHAPSIETTRIRTPIREFDWRLETEKDRQHPDRVFSGGGEWETVSIPHFGAPIGKAATWYRTTVPRPRPKSSERVFLHFDAVDYRAHVFIICRM